MNVAEGRIVAVHHLNCATFYPVPTIRVVTHVLAVEYDHGVVLVDSGLGSADVERSSRRLGMAARTVRPVLHNDETALTQLQLLGISAEDVTAIVATHLDYDHIGGASDFPRARIHTTARELDAATSPATRRERMRYRPAHIQGIHNVQAHDAGSRSEVLGLSSHELDATGSMHLVPMPGHTRGHAAVIVSAPGRGWLVHAGDAALHRAAFTPHGRAPLPFRMAERALAIENRRTRTNHQTLSRLRENGHRVFCSHDTSLFDALHAESHSHNQPST